MTQTQSRAFYYTTRIIILGMPNLPISPDEHELEKDDDDDDDTSFGCL
jgi:hypothetical protein